MQPDGHIVFLNPGGGVDVDDGLDHDRIGEENLAMLQLVGGAGKSGGALDDVDAAENCRLGDGSPDAEIDAAGQLRVGVLEVELGRGEDMNIQPHMAGGRVGIRRHASRRGRGKAGKVHIRANDEARDLDAAGEQHIGLATPAGAGWCRQWR